MLLLHSRTEPGRGRAPRDQSASNRRRDHTWDERQSLPVRDLPEHPIRTPVARGRRRVTEKGKKKPTRGNVSGHDAAPAAAEVKRASRFATTRVEIEGREVTTIV